MSQALTLKILLAILLAVTAILGLVRHHEAVIDTQNREAQASRRAATAEEKKKEADSLKLDDKAVGEYKPK